MGFECIYRPPLSILDADASVLARLAILESRIQAMDQRHLSETISSSTPSRDNTLGSPQAVVTPWPKVPEFHHAAAHKMFHYWSKLRINISPPELEPLHFFKQVDDADTFLVGSKFESHISGTIYYAELMRAIDLLFEEIMHLPFILRHLLTSGGLSRNMCIDVFGAHAPAKPDPTVTLDFVDQSAEELLIQTVALKHLAAKESSVVLSQKADLAFRYALERMWMMQSQQSPQALPFKFLFVIIMLYLYGRPFHALGILQSLESLIHNTSPSSQGDISARARYEAYFYQYFLLESDILTEIDGVPSHRLHNIGLPTAFDAVTTPPNLMGSEPGSSLTYDYAIQELHSHLTLRGYLNSVLANLYTTERAYCRPDEIAANLTDIARRLDIWYWSLPLEMRFPRHPAAFLLTIPRMSDKMVSMKFQHFRTIINQS
ncbi:hypothetical protein LTR84_011231 [Exophiala bonariae]|uniref:Uncharacterized protein n=1 Tax=Exophiala bonariae TaxID=1690606 RepID=A0AAV9NIJ2_9EURO|nr:hypothetical protein LTR84_011231 [Exophiala bonariae]